MTLGEPPQDIPTRQAALEQVLAERSGNNWVGATAMLLVDSIREQDTACLSGFLDRASRITVEEATTDQLQSLDTLAMVAQHSLQRLRAIGQ
jgi:hypothetical protein